MPQLPNRLRLNLPDPFLRHTKLLPHFVQSRSYGYCHAAVVIGFLVSKDSLLNVHNLTRLVRTRRTERALCRPNALEGSGYCRYATTSILRYFNTGYW